MRPHIQFLFAVALLPIFLLCASYLFAHEEHTQSSPTKPGETATANHHHHDEGEDEDEASSGPPRPIPIPFTGNLKHHLHNKIVHFPLALGIVGSLFVLIGLKRPEMMNAARI